MSDLLDTLRGPVLLAATVAAGLQAGTYYTWACGVMPGLARTDDHTFVSSMNHINVAIVNPVFMLTFLGAPALAAAAVATSTPGARGWAIAGLVLALGTVVVTGRRQRPAQRRPGGGRLARGLRDLWVRWNVVRTVTSAWVRWNVVRTLTSTGALACLAWAAWRS